MPKLSEVIAAQGQPAAKPRMKLSEVVASAPAAGAHASDVPYADGSNPYTAADLMPAAMAPERDHTVGEYAENALRGVPLALRSLGRGAAGTLDLVAAPLAQGINAGLDSAGVDPRNHQLTGTEIFDKVYGATGLPMPETTGERYVDRIGQGLGGSLGGAGVGRLLAGSESAVASGLGNTLASNPVAQGVGAVASGAAAQGAHEANLGPVAEVAAGLGGAFLPALPATSMALIRGAFRGGEQGRRNVEQSLADFEAAGTTPTVAQATGSNARLAAESALAKTPGAAGVMADKSAQQAEEIQQGVGKLASRLSPASEPAQAGLAIERGITGQGGFIDRFKANASRLYDQLDKFLPEGTRVPTSATAQALDELVEPIAGAPALSKFFINGKVSSIKGALDADTGPNSPMNRPDVAEEVNRLRNVAADTNAAAAAETASQNAAIDKQNTLRAVLGQKPKDYVEPPGPVSADDDIASLLSRMQDGKLPYEALKKLRTLVGEELANPSLASDVKSSAWRKLYTGLTEDLQGAAKQAGPEAEQAWNRANTYFKAGQNRIEALDRVVEKAGGPEAVFNAATSGTKDGAFTIRNVMQSLQPDQRKVLSAAVLRRLGNATPGTATEQGEFSISSFLTNYNKLSPQAKSTLFDRYGSGFREDLDSIARVAGNLRGAAKVGANPSGSAAAGIRQAALSGFAISALTGHYGPAAGIAATAGAANVTARAMTSPTFVKWLAKSTDIPRAQWFGSISALIDDARGKGDQAAVDAGEALRQQLYQRNREDYKRDR